MGNRHIKSCRKNISLNLQKNVKNNPWPGYILRSFYMQIQSGVPAILSAEQTPLPRVETDENCSLQKG